jgi:hypothetical protein
VLHCDASLNVCRADLSLLTISCNVLGGHYRNIVSGLMGGGKETKQGYEATYDACQSAFHLVCKLPACHDDDCNTCKVIKGTVTQPLLQSYLSSEDAEAKKLPVVCVTADSGKAVGGFALDVFCLQVSPVSSLSTGTSLNLRRCTTSSTRGSPVQLSTHSQ